MSSYSVQAPHDPSFCDLLLQSKATTHVFTEGLKASVAVVRRIAGALQALLLPPDETPVAVAEGKSAFVAVLKNMIGLWETLWRYFIAA